MAPIDSQVRDAGAPCPRCGAALEVREVSMRHSARPDEAPRWVVASRGCSAGCVLLAGDLEGIQEAGGRRAADRQERDD